MSNPNDENKFTWTVRMETTVHADTEEEAIALAKADFALENCVIETRQW